MCLEIEEQQKTIKNAMDFLIGLLVPEVTQWNIR